MIFLTGPARMGKTSLAKLNSYSTMSDLITSTGLFGSLFGDTSYHTDDRISSKSNGLIPTSWVSSRLYELDKGIRRGTFSDPRLFLFSPGLPDNDVSDLQRRLQMSVEIDNSDPIGILIHRLTSSISAELRVPDGLRSSVEVGRGVVNVRWQDVRHIASWIEPYFAQLLRAPFYIRIGDRFFNMAAQQGYVVPFLKDLQARSFLLKGYMWRGHPVIDIIGAMISVTDQSNGDDRLMPALSHSEFVNGVNFIGLPVIFSGEDGPRPIDGYHARDGMALNTHNLAHSPDLIDFDYDVNQATLNPAIGRNSQHHLFTMDVTIPFNPTLLLLSCNRCFIDSISSTMYGQDGPATSGGLSIDVIAMLYQTQMKECIGVYSPIEDGQTLTGKISKDRSDPLLGNIRDAHLCGRLTFDSEIRPKKAHFTTRHSNRTDHFWLFDDNRAYGNRVLIEKPNLSEDELNLALSADSNASYTRAVVSADYNSRVVCTEHLGAQVQAPDFRGPLMTRRF